MNTPLSLSVKIGEQLELFPEHKEILSIDKPIRLITLFSGYDSQAMALRNIGADFEIYKTSEWQIQSTLSAKEVFHSDDKTDYSKDLSDMDVMEKLIDMGISLDDKNVVTLANLKRKGIAYCRNIFNTFKACNNLGSITKIKGKDLDIVEKNNYNYFMFYSFCCQDLSLAGKRAGMKKGSGTRSGLLWEVERLLSECKEYNNNLPDVLCMENVPQVLKAEGFDEWQSFLCSLGYRNFISVLNAKDYGIPQNRKRAFMFSFLKPVNYKFPETIELKYVCKDILEKSVDDRYYITSDKAKNLITDLENKGILTDVQKTIDVNYKKIGKERDIAKTLAARDYKGFGTGFDTMNGVVEVE